MRKIVRAAVLVALASVVGTDGWAQSYDRDDEEEDAGGEGGGYGGGSWGGGSGYGSGSSGGTRGGLSGFSSGIGGLGGGYQVAPDIYIAPSTPSVVPTAPVATSTPEGQATRIFAGPGMFPPERFAAYAIVAFPSHPLPQDRDRYVEICRGYVAAILAFSEVQLPLDRQLVTVWPVSQDYVAMEVMELPGTSGCDRAVDTYGLATSLQALKDAYRALGETDEAKLKARRGPFVLAWSPTHFKGAEDALILRMDLSDVETATQAREKFEAWRDEIEAKQHLWIDGWKEDGLAPTIGNWADRWGEEILSLFRGD